MLESGRRARWAAQGAAARDLANSSRLERF